MAPKSASLYTQVPGQHLAELGQVERGAEGRQDVLSARSGLVQEVVQGSLATYPAPGAARESVYAQPPAALPAQDPGNHLHGTHRSEQLYL